MKTVIRHVNILATRQGCQMGQGRTVNLMAGASGFLSHSFATSLQVDAAGGLPVYCSLGLAMRVNPGKQAGKDPFAQLAGRSADAERIEAGESGLRWRYAEATAGSRECTVDRNGCGTS